MTLDQRAREAAHGLQETVAEANLALFEAGVPAGRAPRGVAFMLRPSMAAFAGAFVAVLVLAGMLAFQTGVFAPADTAQQPTVIIDNEAPVVESTAPAAPSTPATDEEPAASVPVPTAAEEVEAPPPDTTPPELVISSPKDGDRFEEKVIRFEGITEPGAVVMAGRYEADVAEDGSWGIALVLSPGGNRATITATDAAGNAAEASVTVYYDAPKETTTTKAEVVWEFTAHFTYGSCSENPPYDEYYGTGKPGTTISVTSEYGSGSTTVNGEGEYWLRVYFETAPVGKTFVVKVKDQFGNSKFFEFVYTGA